MNAIRNVAALLLVLALAACGASDPVRPELPAATAPGTPSFGGNMIGSGS